MQYIVIGTTVVRVVGSYETPDIAEAVAAELNKEFTGRPAEAGR